MEREERDTEAGRARLGLSGAPRWVSRAVVEAIHSDLIQKHGGSRGVRDYRCSNQHSTVRGIVTCTIQMLTSPIWLRHTRLASRRTMHSSMATSERHFR